jgi:hypothetical protein
MMVNHLYLQMEIQLMLLWNVLDVEHATEQLVFVYAYQDLLEMPVSVQHVQIVVLEMDNV